MAFNVIGAQSDGSTLVVWYNEPPGTGADDSTNYAITGGFSVSGTGTVFGNSVTFSASGGVADGTVYTLTVTGVVSAGSSEALTNGVTPFSLPVSVLTLPLTDTTPVEPSSPEVHVVTAPAPVGYAPAAPSVLTVSSPSPEPYTPAPPSMHTVEPVPPVMYFPAGPSVRALPVPGVGPPSPPPVRVFRMRGQLIPPPNTVIQWDSPSAPDGTGALSGQPPGTVGDIIVLYTTVQA